MQLKFKKTADDYLALKFATLILFRMGLFGAAG